MLNRYLLNEHGALIDWPCVCMTRHMSDIWDQYCHIDYGSQNNIKYK